MSRTVPEYRTIAAAVALAVRAPSVHNTQPWLWRVGERSLHLYADLDRRLPETDLDGRDLVISCGAALHHAQVAFAALGWHAEVRRLPNPAEPTHLAVIELHRHQPTADEVELCAAISARRSDRRQLSPRPVPPELVETLSHAAPAEDVLITAATGEARLELAAATAAAAYQHAASLAYRCEIRRWSGKRLSSEGVPSANTPPPTIVLDGIPARYFSSPGLWQGYPVGVDDSEAAWVVLSTADDDRLAQLRAGEATSAALLGATLLGLASCPLSEALEIPATREQIRERVTGRSYPQMIVRLGWPPHDAPALPATPRRAVHDVLGPLSTEQFWEHCS